MTLGNGDRPQRGRRVVITGIGAVSPNGVGRESFWQATRDGKSGIRRIDRFDLDGFPTQIAGQVEGFDPLEHLPQRELKHVSHAVPMAIAAGAEALADGGLEPRELSLDERRRFAVVIGSGGAGMEFMERQFREHYEMNEASEKEIREALICSSCYQGPMSNTA